MNPPAKLTDLMDAIEFEFEDYHTYFDRQTGRIISVEKTILSAVEEGDDDALTDAPDWQGEEVEAAKAIVDDPGSRFIPPPYKFDFNEYRHMERFIRSLPDTKAAEQLWRAIKGRGAFRYFKDTLYRLGIEKQWFRYRDEQLKQFVIEWAEANNVAYEDDTQKRIQ